MAYTYEYLIYSPGQFLIKKRWYDKDNKPHLVEYRSSYKKKKWMCDCAGYNYSKKIPKTCKHIKSIIHELKQKDLGILRMADEVELIEFDWNKHVRKK